jgi:hypothetical protein
VDGALTMSLDLNGRVFGNTLGGGEMASLVFLAFEVCDGSILGFGMTFGVEIIL